MCPAAKAFSRVFRAANSMEAHLVKGMLEQHDIEVRMFGEGLSTGLGELPADVVQVDIEVPVGYRQLARELIDEYEARLQDRGTMSSTWSCERCGENNPASFDVCWSCGSVSGNLE